MREPEAVVEVDLRLVRFGGLADGRVGAVKVMTSSLV